VLDQYKYLLGEKKHCFIDFILRRIVIEIFTPQAQRKAENKVKYLFSDQHLCDIFKYFSDGVYFSIS
jgi:hypothetical protein